MSKDGLSTEYENAVADVLAYLAGPSAVVTRDVKLQGASGIKRQLDVVVEGTIYGFADAMLVVDCKRWKKKIDVADAHAFQGLVKDVHADFGMIVTTMGASEAARTALKQSGGLRSGILSLDELNAWRPPGTRSVTFKVPLESIEDASSAIRRAGARAHVDHHMVLEEGFVALEGYRHYPYDQRTPDSIVSTLSKALQQVKLTPEVVSTGTVSGGGTPNHKWLMVTADGIPTGHKILAADEREAMEQVAAVKDYFGRSGIEAQAMSFDIDRPEGWPMPRKMFG